MKGPLKNMLAMSGFVIGMLLSGGVVAEGLAGEWILSIDTPRGITHPTLVINRDGDSYTGVYNSRRGPIEIKSIDIDGANFSFPLVITVPIGDIEVNYRGTISGDNMTGSVENARGQVPFTGKRKG